MRYSDPVPEELRGWSYHSPPIKPRAYLGLSMWDIAYNYCNTRRDVFMRKVMNVKGNYEKPQLVLGNYVHKVFSKALKDVRAILVLSKDPIEVLNDLKFDIDCPENIKEYCVKLYKYLVLMWVSESIKSQMFYGGEAIGFIPWLSEIRVDGSYIGLSDRLCIDALADFAIVEIKAGKKEEFHKLSLAGYALAVESNLDVPVDYGVLVYINGFQRNQIEIRFDEVYISPDLRKEFLDRRDEVIDMILSGRDPGMPERCPDTCPFYEVCRK